MRILLTLAAGLLALELVLAGVAAALGLAVWRQRMHDIPRLDLSRRGEVLVALSCLLGLVLLGVGLRSTTALVAGGAVALVGSATALARQLRHGDRGQALTSYLVFTACSVLVVVLAPLG